MTSREELILAIARFLTGEDSTLSWYYHDVDLSKRTCSPAWEDANMFDQLMTSTRLVAENHQVRSDIVSTILQDILSNEKKLAGLSKHIVEAAGLARGQIVPGLLGKFNEKDRAYRNAVFFERLKKTGRVNKKLVLAEGDSWFQFPRIFLGLDMVSDILDHLINDGEYLVYSLAYGGDWLSDILQESEFITELPKLSPDAFLLSGGGNDLVGNMRLSTFIENPYIKNGNVCSKSADDIILNSKHLSDLRNRRRKESNSHSQRRRVYDDKLYTLGLTYLNSSFFRFMNLMMLQYFILMISIKKIEEFRTMKVLTHGYDFVIPKGIHIGNKFFYSLRYKLFGLFNGNGKWLQIPLKMKGVEGICHQRSILYVIIYELNEMLISLAESTCFPNVYHIDCRGVSKTSNDGWFDELHLGTDGYREISRLYKLCISLDNPGKKVFSVEDLERK